VRVLVSYGPVMRALAESGFAPYLGHLFTPRGGERTAHPDLPIALDNGAFSGFDAAAFRRMVAGFAGHPRLAWIACPDVVGDATATRALFDTWRPELAGLPLAYVLQDGATSAAVPWDAVTAVFVGGSTEWKLGRESCALTAEARRRGKWVHMGRVNTMRRLRIAFDRGCASVDGSKLTRWPATHLPRAVAEVRWLEQQGSLAVVHA
jgi:hypothetical protein